MRLTNLPSGATRIRVGAGPAEKLLPVHAAALCLKAGVDAGPSGAEPDVQRLSSAPLIHFAELSLAAWGIPFERYGDRETIAAQALGMDGYERNLVRADGAVNRPGSFPNLLSALANKVLDAGVEQAEVTYPIWTGRIAGDLPDFKPAPIVAKGSYGSLDELLDAEALKEQGIAEEMLSQIQVARFGNAVKLTPIMVANDDLGAFAEELTALAEGWELTVNRMCLAPIVGNATLLDGYAVYDTNHGNDITSGGVPSVTSWDAMQQKLAAQTTIGNKAYQRSRLAVALVPPTLAVAAQQTFLPLGGTVVVETKQAATDSNINVFRGTVAVAIEPELQAASTAVWYGFADPANARNATIVRGYMRGFPDSGRRERWYDPTTKCLHVSLEGRAAAAVKQYRTTVRNAGA